MDFDGKRVEEFNSGKPKAEQITEVMQPRGGVLQGNVLDAEGVSFYCTPFIPQESSSSAVNVGHRMVHAPPWSFFVNDHSHFHRSHPM